jgi:hypothetical protein
MNDCIYSISIFDFNILDKIDFDKKSKMTQHLDTKTHKNLTSIIESKNKLILKTKIEMILRKNFHEI